MFSGSNRRRWDITNGASREKKVPTKERIRDIEGGVLCIKGWR